MDGISECKWDSLALKYFQATSRRKQTCRVEVILEEIVTRADMSAKEYFYRMFISQDVDIITGLCPIWPASRVSRGPLNSKWCKLGEFLSSATGTLASRGAFQNFSAPLLANFKNLVQKHDRLASKNLWVDIYVRSTHLKDVPVQRPVCVPKQKCYVRFFWGMISHKLFELNRGYERLVYI